MKDQNRLSYMRKKPSKSFREHAIKWNELAGQVKTPLDEHELVDILLENQDPYYSHHLTAATGRPFHSSIKIGEMVESGLKIGRIVSHESNQSYNTGHSGLFRKFLKS